ncbi:MAG: serine/threonine-protein phosphatase, partial [Actinomycetota bacterium]|nr:serine/threonine-protein phosphatase [Actinomycetota bacterium]
SILGPTVLPSGFAVRYEPALAPLEVGGDWYDVITLDEHRTAVVVGDCVGRGLQAASVMGQLRSACRALLLQTISPSRALSALDDFADVLPEAICTTVFCAIVDTGRGELVYSSAGHPPAIVAGAGGDLTLLDKATSVPLGVRAGMDRPEERIDLALGATLLLYTDGLIERRGEGIDDGIARAGRVLTANLTLPVDALVDRIVTELGHDSGQADDVAVLIYRHEVHQSSV